MRLKLTLPLLLSIVLAVSIVVSIATTVFVSRSLDRYLAQLNAEIALDRRALGSVRTVTGDGSALEKLSETRRRSGAVLRTVLNPTVAPQALIAEDALAEGVAITNDGWFAFFDSARVSTSESAIAQLELVTGDRVFSIDRILRDGRNGILYVKVSGSPEAVVPFSETLAMEPGDELFITGMSGFVQKASIVQEDFSSNFSIAFDTEFSATWDLNINPPQQGLLFDGDSGFIGFLISGRPVPLHDFASSLSSAIQARQLSQPTLGVSGVDVTRAQNFDTSNYGRKGFLISTDAAHIGILPDGPAANAGLEVGDMIIAIEGVLIDSTNSITKILSQFSPGNRVTVSYIRDGQERTTDVVLGNAQDLLY